MARDEDNSSMSPLMLDETLPSSGYNSPRLSPIRFISSRRRVIVAAAAAFFLLSLYTLSSFSSSLPQFVSQKGQNSVVSLDNTSAWDRKSALLGPPTRRFRDNLRNDTQYITSWISAGWTNDVMTYGNLIYLALITERVPIIGPFTPSHIGRDSGNIPFGEVFDIDYLSEKIGIPVLEWHEVKNLSTPDVEVEDIGCWSVWDAVQSRDPGTRPTNALELHGLDISFTTGPAWLEKFPGYEHDPHAHFWSIASLLYPGRDEVSILPQPSRLHGAVLPPDQHLACFDYLYYVCATTSFEYDQDVSPAWRFVVKHFRWTSRLQNIANGYLRRMFDVPDGEPIPPYIAIHARHGDFVSFCNGVPREDCFTSVATYQRRIAEIQEETRERLGLDPQHVLILSDETDPAWWDSIRAAGWYTVDHVAEDTVNIYGRWYPVFIDAVLQSSGIGLIGTHGSTMSVLAGRRVHDWYNGVYKDVQFFED